VKIPRAGDDPQYLVTKHHGAMACCIGRIQSTLTEARKIADVAGLGKGQFKSKATVKIWKLIAEREIN
jgi:hypothetical protein